MKRELRKFLEKKLPNDLEVKKNIYIFAQI